MSEAEEQRRTETAPVALPEIRSRIPLPVGGGVMRKLLAFAGPGFLIAVGYMDPGTGRRIWRRARAITTRCCT